MKVIITKQYEHYELHSVIISILKYVWCDFIQYRPSSLSLGYTSHF